MTPIDPNAAASPLPTDSDNAGRRGLTIRAELAARAMQGLLSHDGLSGIGSERRDSLALHAVWYADSLIAALNAPPSQ